LFLSDECKCAIGFWYVLEKKDYYCERCTARIKSERYLLFLAYYCDSCMNTMENDPDYKFILGNNRFIPDPLNELRQIEN